MVSFRKKKDKDAVDPKAKAADTKKTEEKPKNFHPHKAPYPR